MKLLALLLLLFCTVVPTVTHASEMDRVTRAVEVKLGIRRTHIPLLGFAMFVGKVGSGFQMPGVKLAVFEDARLSSHTAQDLEIAVSNALGEEWTPFVKSISNHGGEQTWIYLRPEGKRLHMFIATAASGEVSLIEVKASERQMRRWIKDKDTD